MVAAGHDDYTVTAISGHASTRMLARYTHPTDQRKIRALGLPWMGTNRAHADDGADGDRSTAAEITKLLKESGGRQEDRTPDLRVASAARRKTYLIGASAHRRNRVR